jgi:hypothetical protein
LKRTSALIGLCIFAFVRNGRTQLIPDTGRVTGKRNDSVLEKKNYAGFRIYSENDFFAPFVSNTDDNYTGGLRAEIITNIIKAKPAIIFNPLKGKIHSLSFLFGFTSFTPRDLADPNIIYTDRPYASFRFWGIGISSINLDTTWKLSYELQLGAIGRPGVGNSQSYIHRHHIFGTQRDVPMGWKYQIGYNGIFAFNLYTKLEKRIWSSGWKGRKKNFRVIQITGRGEMNLGQYLINAAVEPRISLFNWNHNFGEFEDEPGLPVKADPPSPPTTSVKRKNKAGFYIFGSIRPRFVLHNTTLTGKLLGRSSVYTIAPSELKHLLFEYDCGLAFRWCFLRLGYNVFGRSKEFSFQNKNFHTWGGFYIGGIFKFR